MINLPYTTKYVATDNSLNKSFMDQVVELTQSARKRQTEIMQRKLERELDTKPTTMKSTRKINPTKKSVNKIKTQSP